MESAVAGFGLGFSLILAIGAQNAFVLRQGLRREHVFPIALTCAVSDAILIIAGVAGFGWLAEAAPWIQPVFRYGGAAFLIVYGFLNARSAWRGGAAMDMADSGGQSLGKAIAICLALTWLNPHVYLDTLALLGSISTEYPQPWLFGAGAVVSSFFFFFSLAYGARLLAPLFAKPRAWQVLDAIIALTMWAIALKLILG